MRSGICVSTRNGLENGEIKIKARSSVVTDVLYGTMGLDGKAFNQLTKSIPRKYPRANRNEGSIHRILNIIKCMGSTSAARKQFRKTRTPRLFDAMNRARGHDATRRAAELPRIKRDSNASNMGCRGGSHACVSSSVFSAQSAPLIPSWGLPMCLNWLSLTPNARPLPTAVCSYNQPSWAGTGSSCLRHHPLIKFVRRNLPIDRAPHVRVVEQYFLSLRAW